MKINFIGSAIAALAFWARPASGYLSSYVSLKAGFPEGARSLCKTAKHCYEFWGAINKQEVPLQLTVNIYPVKGGSYDSQVYKALELCYAPNGLPIQLTNPLNIGLMEEESQVEEEIVENCLTVSPTELEGVRSVIAVKGLTRKQCRAVLKQMERVQRHCAVDGKRILAQFRKSDRVGYIALAIISGIFSISGFLLVKVLWKPNPQQLFRGIRQNPAIIILRMPEDRTGMNVNVLKKRTCYQNPRVAARQM